MKNEILTLEQLKEVPPHTVFELLNQVGLIVGALIMSFGIAFIKIFSLIHSETIQFSAEIIGAGIHGIGLLPFINSIEKIS